MNDTEIAMFKALSTNTAFKSYMEKLCDALCDVRNWKEVTETEAYSHKLAVELILQHIIGYLNTDPPKPKEEDGSPYV